MEREAIVERIRAHAPQLGEFDVAKLSLFGSVARGDSGPESDVEFRGAATFENFMGLKIFLEDLWSSWIGRRTARQREASRSGCPNSARGR